MHSRSSKQSSAICKGFGRFRPKKLGDQGLDSITARSPQQVFGQACLLPRTAVLIAVTMDDAHYFFTQTARGQHPCAERWDILHIQPPVFLGQCDGARRLPQHAKERRLAIECIRPAPGATVRVCPDVRAEAAANSLGEAIQAPTWPRPAVARCANEMFRARGKRRKTPRLRRGPLEPHRRRAAPGGPTHCCRNASLSPHSPRRVNAANSARAFFPATGVACRCEGARLRR